MKSIPYSAGLCLMALLAVSASAAESYSPDADRSYPTDVYWGDTHVHTSFSTSDANLQGGNDLPPTIAYRFARGDRVRAKNGMPVRIRRPLDFLVIADPELAVTWKDPDFRRREPAFYYVRVLEIPTPRWTAYDAKFFGVKDIPGEIPMVSQERAYTSPIWYTPDEGG